MWKLIQNAHVLRPKRQLKNGLPEVKFNYISKFVGMACLNTAKNEIAESVIPAAIVSKSSKFISPIMDFEFRFYVEMDCFLINFEV